ncbi:PilZ domain-containing protein [Actinoplanes sp. NPDC049118]|uniref:flagellar brake protein n=1 Tax=Actinoplanes sp. NPDC049118 TaxID=3155769 RepID=UPI0033C31E09
MSTTLADLPDINDLVDVTLDSRAEPLAAVISAVTAETVLLREPMDRTGRIVRPETGERGLLVWGEGSQLRQAPIEVLETNGAPAPTWLIRLTAQAERTQRRSFVRANVSLPVVVRYAGVDLEITAVDLSEGGMRCYTGSEINFGRGDSVVAEFTPGRPLSAEATVVRMRRGDGERPTELGLRFMDLKMGEADDIRRYVFRQLHEQRRRGAE